MIRETRRVWLSFLVRAMLCLILGALLFQAAFYSITMARSYFSDGRLNHYIEAFRVERVLAGARGESIYGDQTKYPYAYIAYGPMIYFPVSAILRVLPQPETRLEMARQALMVGRTISMLATVLLLAGLTAIAWHFGLRRWWVLMPFLLFFCARPIYDMAYVFRGDMPMAALAIWAWFAALRGKGIPSAIAAAILMVLAFLYKPPALTSAFLLGCWLLVDKQFLRAIVFGGAYWILYGLVWVLTKIMTPDQAGEIFSAANTSSFLERLHIPALWEFFVGLASWPVPLVPFVLALGAVLVLPGRSIQPEKETPRLTPLVFAFVGSFVMAEILVLRVGSGIYYYIETYSWAVLLAAFLGRYIVQHLRACLSREVHAFHRSGFGCYVGLLVLIILTLLFAHHTRRLISERERLGSMESWPERNPQLVRVLNAIEGEVLLDEGYLYWFTQAPPTLMSPQGYSAGVHAGVYPPDPVVERIRNHQYEAIVLRYDARRKGIGYQNLETYPPVINQAIVEHYELDAYINPYYVYRPKNRTPVPMENE
ncbi:MAG: hypothetical protein ACLFUS_08770 [Candidatus Sumerlaeia bacterium]